MHTQARNQLSAPRGAGSIVRGARGIDLSEPTSGVYLNVWGSDVARVFERGCSKSNCYNLCKMFLPSGASRELFLRVSFIIEINVKM